MRYTVWSLGFYQCLRWADQISSIAFSGAKDVLAFHTERKDSCKLVVGCGSKLIFLRCGALMADQICGIAFSGAKDMLAFHTEHQN